jgi:hypothetical protein
MLLVRSLARIKMEMRRFLDAGYRKQHKAQKCKPPHSRGNGASLVRGSHYNSTIIPVRNQSC